MRYGWLTLAAVMLVAVACSGGKSDLKALPVEGALSSEGSDCQALKTLQIAFSPSTSGAAAEVYAVKARKVDSDYVATLAEKLGISGEPTEEPGRFIVNDDPRTLTVDKHTGDIMFDSGYRPTSSDEKKTLTNDEAIKKAEQFL